MKKKALGSKPISGLGWFVGLLLVTFYLLLIASSARAECVGEVGEVRFEVHSTVSK